MASTERKVANLTVKSSGFREIVDDIFAIKECLVQPPIENLDDEVMLQSWYENGKEIHSSQTAYLINGDKTLLFDTLSPGGRDIILDSLDSLLDGELDYLVLSHPEANHAGNAGAILEKYPDATLVVPGIGEHHELFGLDKENENTMFVGSGDELPLGEKEIRFVEAKFMDHSIHIWMHELSNNILFTVDWMGFGHLEGECLDFTDELNTDVTNDQFERFNGYALQWLRFVDPDRTDDAIDEIQADIEPDIIAPAHGQIMRENTSEYFDMMKEVIRNISTFDEDFHIHTHQMIRFTE